MTPAATKETELMEEEDEADDTNNCDEAWSMPKVLRNKTTCVERGRRRHESVKEGVLEARKMQDGKVQLDKEISPTCENVRDDVVVWTKDERSMISNGREGKK